MLRRRRRRFTWFTGTLILVMPIVGIFFLASQVALNQVNGKFQSYLDIPEVTRLAELRRLPPGTVVMLRGRISPTSCRPSPCTTDAEMANLIIYQEQPANDRTVRFQEHFKQIFPTFVLDLSDGAVTILPSLTRQRVLQRVRHTVVHGDRQRSGFRLGDLVTVQGRWHGNEASFDHAPQKPPFTRPALADVTGITSDDKQRLLKDWQHALQQVQWARNILGFLTGLGIVMLLVHRRRTRTVD